MIGGDMSKTFEEWLEEWHIELYPQILDDDLPDAFDHWLSSLDTEELLKYGKVYGVEMFLAGKREVLEALKVK